MSSGRGPIHQQMFEQSAIGRVGITDEIPSAAQLLLAAEFITGSEALIDVGVIAVIRPGEGTWEWTQAH